MRLKELAEHLGLSQTTVSRALNGYPEVKEATRLRVSEAALELGYRPNASALRLATGRASAVGMVLRGADELGPHMSEFLSGLGGRMATQDIDIVVTTVASQQEELAAYRRLAASQRVDAMILHSPTLNDERAELLMDLKIPFVLHGRTNATRPVAWLDIDNTGGLERATSHLLDLGHRRIALLNGVKGRTFAEHRELGYMAALSARGVAFDPALMGNTAFTDEVAFRMAQSMLELRPRPTAFLAGSMMTALGVFRAIRQAGMTLGTDVSMIAHDDVFPYLNADNMYPTMSTTRSSIRQAGSRIAELLLQLLGGKPVSEIHELWPVELVLRESSGPAPLF
ncbi:substrate-binding domain-containing protein [Devosia sp. BK]|uniref:substrate-binding domain-containing protein n=1 Tax=unclassified Devosia TaxID=196773 RepID=UPI000713892C|nr:MULTISPECIES: substrate-binding domain-containing protein [unclassified Devosia]KQN69822.1 transcriptional regulator [Devosia sp. Leaf64]KQT45940.1 transcriptional regulator [Devosia sp. Leaf420]MDV3250057.1 substrate-binding domain-containing protein [Devosia sp. BK]